MNQHASTVRRRSIGVLLAMTLGALGAYGSVDQAEAKSERMKVRSSLSLGAKNDYRTIVFHVRAPRASVCTGSIQAARVKARLPKIRTDRRGRASWRWRLLPTSPSGKWVLRASCRKKKKRGKTARIALVVNRASNSRGYVGTLETLDARRGRITGFSSLSPRGWATDGDPRSPNSQIEADRRYARQECSVNSLLIFRVRGSGEVPGTDEELLGGWTFEAGQNAVVKGWRVRDMQARYTAPSIAIDKWLVDSLKATRFLRGRARYVAALAVFASRFKGYRDVATNEWNRVSRDLIEAHERCPQRKIMIAGYSQGGIVLRYVIPRLPQRVLDQIVSVDLVADPMADQRVDHILNHEGAPPNLRARQTGRGLDTAANSARPFFRQRQYPRSVADKTVQYCAPYDLVCEVNAVNVGRVAQQKKHHRNYPVKAIGRWRASQLDTHTHTTSTDAPDGQRPPSAPSLSITGTCTTAGGTLRSISQNFTPGGRATIRAWYPDGRPYTNLRATSTVQGNGSITWQWPCAGDPAGTYATEVSDAATGRSTGRVPFRIDAIGTPEPPPPPPPTTRTITVNNTVIWTIPPGYREDSVPAPVTARADQWRSADAIASYSSGATLTAVCHTNGRQLTDGNNSITDDDPWQYTSTLVYGISLPDGRRGYIHSAWTTKRNDGLGLPAC